MEQHISITDVFMAYEKLAITVEAADASAECDELNSLVQSRDEALARLASRAELLRAYLDDRTYEACRFEYDQQAA